ncbi:hypothetical protein HYV58_01410 [Candidatus Peregrinibacteria bacterium]|nr:hypothetical protein [Candidatus Peregrinibacteria bacterium]
MEQYSRREFLEQASGIGVRISVLPALLRAACRDAVARITACPTPAYTPPRYNESIGKFLAEHNLTVLNAEALSGGGAVLHYRIVDKRNTDLCTAEMFALQEYRRGYFDLTACDGDRPEKFAHRAMNYKSAAKNERYLLTPHPDETAENDPPNFTSVLAAVSPALY